MSMLGLIFNVKFKIIINSPRTQQAGIASFNWVINRLVVIAVLVRNLHNIQGGPKSKPLPKACH